MNRRLVKKHAAQILLDALDHAAFWRERTDEEFTPAEVDKISAEIEELSYRFRERLNKLCKE